MSSDKPGADHAVLPLSLLQGLLPLHRGKLTADIVANCP
jgi:hypothetical protein